MAIQVLDKPIRYPQSNVCIEEFAGFISTHQSDVSIARIQCGNGWTEPPQTPDFDEYVIVKEGVLCVTPEGGTTIEIQKDQVAFVPRGETIHYSTLPNVPVDYYSICLPAFDLGLANRQPE